MFSKALFKQSMKAHWVKWLAVTLSTCIMLAIVIIVLGNLGINDIRDSLKNIFVQADSESSLKEDAIDSYELYLTTTDSYNVLRNYSSMVGTITNMYDLEISKLDNPTQEQKEDVANSVIETLSPMLPTYGSFDKNAISSFLFKLLITHDANPSLTGLELIQKSYCNMVYDEAYEKSLNEDGLSDAEAIMQAKGAEEVAEKAINNFDTISNNTTDFVYDRENFTTYAREDVNLILSNNTYETLKGQLGDEEAKEQAVVIKVLSNTAITTYQFYINEFKQASPDKTVTEDQILEARTNSCKSISDQIPSKVGEALTELGNMDVYGLIIGSIFYRIAGLLLPMVFVIITANGLLAGQVDSGSMTYVLSTPTKRRAVTVTQMVYLVSALFAMFSLLTIVSVISIAIVGGNSFAINFSEILLFNLGAFLTTFAIAGYCFMCSAIFNRTKHSLGIGGGLTIFSLVCTILGLFGSSVVPSAMRISAMNFFNYLSIITLFDTVAILDGALNYLWKFGILLAFGIITFIVGILRFDKKDLPL